VVIRIGIRISVYGAALIRHVPVGDTSAWGQDTVRRVEFRRRLSEWVADEL